MYSIVQSPSEILRTPAQDVTFSGPKLQKIVEEMISTMVVQHDPQGVGLAANQVGLPWKIFVARLPAGRQGEPVQVFINPEIVKHSEEFQTDSKDKKDPLEGCLSKPNYYGHVKRWKWITLKYQEPTSNHELLTKSSNFDDFAATVVQHEMDHLEGKLFIERILEQKGKLYVISGKDKKGKELWEEVDI